MDNEICELCWAANSKPLIINVDADLSELPELHSFPNGWYFIPLCLACRERLIGHLLEWRRQRLAERETPKDPNGYPEFENRVVITQRNGTLVGLTVEEYKEWQRLKAEGGQNG